MTKSIINKHKKLNLTMDSILTDTEKLLVQANAIKIMLKRHNRRSK